MNITLTIEDVPTLTDHGSVVAITGTGENGQRITFGADVRAMEPVMQALIIGDEYEVDVEVEDWQILSTEEASS